MQPQSSKLRAVLFSAAAVALTAAPQAQAVAFAHNPASGYAQAVQNQPSASRRAPTAQNETAAPQAAEPCAAQRNAASSHGAHQAQTRVRPREDCGDKAN